MKIIDPVNLRDVEQGVLNYMLFSNKNFLEIKNKLTENDFVFIIHKIIFRYLLVSEEMFLTDEFSQVTDLNSKLEIFADMLNKQENIRVLSTLDILSQAPSINIEKDLEIINVYSMEKETAICNAKNLIKGTIETKDSLIWFDFVSSVLVSVGTTNIAKLPSELHDNFKDTFSAISHLDLQNKENQLSVGLRENSNGIESFYLKKDASQLKWFDNICQWADKYELDENIFPRNKFKLQDLLELDISKKGVNELPKEIKYLSNLRLFIVDDNNIEELPNEFYQLKNLSLFSCIKNKISSISEEIINLKKLLFFGACYNNISLLPNNFFKLKNLEVIFIHGNKIKRLADEIGNLSNLKSICISGNAISVLPDSFSKLKSLESLDIENTHIKEIPNDFLKHKSLNQLTINDDLLPFISKNINYLNVDTIDLIVSNFNKSSQIVQELNLKINQNSSIEDNDENKYGYIQFFKYSKE